MSNKTSKSPKLLRSVALVGAMTGISRLLGLVREQLMAYAFGTSLCKSAFDVAFRIPNLFRRLFGEGALSAAFIPIYTGMIQRGEIQEANRFVRAMAGFLVAVLGTLTGLGILLAWALLQWSGAGEKMLAVLPLLGVMLPYAPLICLAGLLMGVFNAHRKFALPALVPVLLNLVWIIVLALVCPLLSHDPNVRIRAVAWGVVVAGVLQAATLIIPLRRLGVTFGLDFRFHKNPRVIEALKLMAPTALGMGVLQINVCVDGLLAMWAAPWAPAALEYAERLVYLPLGMVGTAFVTVLLPTYSRSATADGGTTEIRATLERAMRDTALVMAPAATGLFILALPVTQLIYGMGEFNADSALRTSRALAAYAPGLFVFMIQKTTTPVFYALKMPRIPMWSGIAFVVLNFCFNLLFVLTLPTEWKHVGIAGSTVVTSALQGFVLARLLRKPIGGIRWRNVLPAYARVLFCAALMGATIYFAHDFFVASLPPLPQKAAQAISMLATIALGATVYLGAAWLFCREPFKEILREFRPRKNK